MIKRKGKINEDRLADLIALRDAAKAEYDNAEAISRTEEAEFYGVKDSIEEELSKEIFKQITSLSDADTSKIQVRVDGYAPRDGKSYFRGFVEINNGNNLHDTQALNWHFRAEVNRFGDDDDEEILFDSGSWSGLDVTSPEKLESLKNDVKILEAINKLNWSKIFSKKFPKISDYMKTKVPSKDTYMQYDNEIFMEKLQNMINNNDAFTTINRQTGRKLFYAPEKISPKTVSFKVSAEGYRDTKELHYLNNKRYSLEEATKIFKDAEIVSLNDYTEAK